MWWPPYRCCAGAAELKPKFGDIDGIYYTDVAGDREACHQAVRNKIVLCRENTSFVSNTENRKYLGCLPIFEKQAMSCVDHFRSEAYKCDGSGSARIDDFTGFSCTVTETILDEDDQVESGQAPEAPENGVSGTEDESARNKAALAAAWQQCLAVEKHLDSVNEERHACEKERWARNEQEGGTIDYGGAKRVCFLQYEQTMRSIVQDGLASCCGPVPGSSAADHRDINCDHWTERETFYNTFFNF